MRGRQGKETDIFHFINQVKGQSRCLDRQVACVITDENLDMLSYGVNKVIKCDQNCRDKENRTCLTVHAEIVAIDNLRGSDFEARYAYLNLFPCVPCQEALSAFIKEIVVFGPRHKNQVFPFIRLEGDLHRDLLDRNGEKTQLAVVQGELAELITAISDYFHRPNKGTRLTDVLGEIVDVELMLNLARLVCWERDHGTYNYLRSLRRAKYEALRGRLGKGLL